jgi:hypothetical protein
MCSISLVAVYTFWGPISGIMNTLLWYADSKDVEISYMAEMRLLLGLSTGIPALVIAGCEYLL